METLCRIRIERMGGIRKRRVGNNLPFAGRHQPGAAPRRLDAGADEPDRANEREGKPRDTQRKALPGPVRIMEILKKTVDIAHYILAVFLPNTKYLSIKRNATVPGADAAARASRCGNRNAAATVGIQLARLFRMRQYGCS